MVANLIAELGRLGAELRVDGDRLVCNAPSGALTTELQGRIRAHKAEIIAFLRDAEAEAASSRAIPRVSRDGGVPLGLVQQRMWLLDRLEPGTTVYNLPGAWRLRGPLNTGAFEAALREVVRRHEVMRARIDWRGEIPVQLAEENLSFDFPLFDLTSVPEDRREAELLRRLEAERDRLFDLGVAPLFRAQLYRLSSDHHVFFFLPHHVIWDGWSWDIMLGEIEQLYPALVRGKPSPLAELPIQFADYGMWHREWMRGPEMERQMEYWRGRLSGEIPRLQLFTDRVRPAMLSQRGVRRLLQLDARVIDSLRDLGRQEGATLFMTLLAAYAVLLHRYSGQTDIIIGAPVQDRLHADSQRLIGAFVNTLVLRIPVDPATTFRDLLRAARDVAVGAYAHQDVPFNRLVEDFQRERSLSHTALFQALLTYQDITNRPPRLGELALSQVHVPTHDAPTDILLGFMVSPTGTLGVFDFNADLFEPPTMDRIVASFTMLLHDAAARPDSSVAALRVLGPDAHQRIVRDFNATEKTFPDVRTDELIAAQMRVNPDRPAVQAGDVRLTYAELDARVAAISRRLTLNGVRTGDLVAICLDRGADLVAAVLAAWRSGAAYVPLDPDYPVARVGHVLSDSGARVVVTTSHLLDVLPSDRAATVLCLDRPEHADAKAAPASERHAADASLAYVIYTSGSTGLPKGVRVPHRAVVNFLTSMAAEPGMRSSDTLLAVTTLAFDISVLELFLPLVVGGQVVIAGREDNRHGEQLAQLVGKVRPTIMQATPSTWQMLFDADWAGAPGLKVLCGGEALSPELARRLTGAVGEVWNMYGPTETTVWSTCGRVASDESRVTIGRPIANTRLYVLDLHGELVNIGVPGELFIGGAGVAAGYHERGELTAERFVPDPVRRDGSLVYRTGDLVRWLADGRLEHLGRMDRQIKLNGFRIEPGEIEAALENLTQIRQAAVAARGDREDKRLVAYVVFSGEQKLTSTELRRELNRTLPAYMIPAIVVPMSDLPLTANGKVDYNALPNPLERVTAARVYEPPVGEVETVIAAMWSELLGGVTVGRHDNFFELGGHSLLSIRAVTALESELGYRLDPRLFFFQTLHQISAGVKVDADTGALTRS